MTFPEHTKVFIVGGYVRDRLLGREGKDHDFVVVGATPQEMLDMGFQQVGADFPVFLHPQTGDEFALARTERKTGSGYNGFETEFGTDVTLEEDLARRDLTINSMAREVVGFNDLGHAKLNDEVIDPFNGMDDLRNGVLRHTTEAFAEDPLRVLRVARFAARFNFAVHPDTMELMKSLVEAGEMEHLTAERVWLEMEKALSEEQPMTFFWTLNACGAMSILFPELGRTTIHTGHSVSRASLRNADMLTRQMLLFARMSHENSEKMFNRLKAPSDVARMTHKLTSVLEAMDTMTLNWHATAEEKLELLKTLDAFRRADDMFVLSSAVGFIGGDRLPSRMDELLEAFREARKVTFKMLTEEQQATLKGPAIGEAIDAERLRRIEGR